MKLPRDVFARLELGLLIGTPGLAALTLMVAALTAGLRGTGALAALLMLPLAVPILIFGAGLIERSGGAGALKLLGPVSPPLVAAPPSVARTAFLAAHASPPPAARSLLSFSNPPPPATRSPGGSTHK